MGTVVVLILLVAIIGLIIWSMVMDRRKGKSSCGHKCGCCPMAGQCHAHKK